MANNEHLTRQATRLFAQGKLKQAEKLFSGMLAEEPENYQLMLMLGLCRRGQGDADGALAHLREAIRHGDNDPETHFYHGRLLLETGQPEMAREALAQTLALNPNHAPARTLLGLVALIQGKAGQAVAELQAAVRAQPRYVPALSTLAIALLETGAVDQAGEFASQAVALEPKSSSAQSALGRVFLAQGQHASAERCFADALADHPANPELNAGMGAVLQAVGRDEEALPYFQKALRSQYGGLRLTLDMARSLARTRRIGEARELVEQAHARLPDHPEVRLRLAEYRLLANDLEGARQLASGPGSDRPEWRLIKARIALAGRELEAARELIGELLRDQDPAVRRQASLLARRIALARLDREAGRKSLGALLEADPPDTDAALLWVDICHATGAEAEAVQAMEKLLSGDSLAAHQRGRLSTALAGIKDRQGDHAAAADHLAEPGWRPAPVLRRLEQQERSGLLRAWRDFDGKLDGVPVDDDWPAPVIVLGWPGSGRELVVAALAGHPRVRLLDSAEIERRRESLGIPIRPEAAAKPDVSDARLARKRFVGGITGGANGVALESAWWEVSTLPALARFFPGARVIVPHATGQDLELHWRFSGYADIEALKRAFRAERVLYEHLKDRLPLEFIAVRRGDLLTDSGAALEALFDRIGLDFRRELAARADNLRRSQPYRPDGHWRHYPDLID